MKFELLYRVDDVTHGWGGALLNQDGQSYQVHSISYLSDAFESLSHAVLDILKGENESCCVFDHEPGCTRLRFVSNGEECKIDVYEFENELTDEEWSKGQKVKSFNSSIKRLKSQYLNSADSLLNSLGTKKYEEVWGYEFPMSLYSSIKSS